jgi:hypothetical protein
MKRKMVLPACILPFVLLLVSCYSPDSEEKAANDLVVSGAMEAWEKNSEQRAGEEEFIEEFLVDNGASEVPSTATVVESVAREWPSKFCSLEIGASRDEVRKIMGEPTLSFRDQNANQDIYEAWGYDLTVFYDIDDKASQIQANSENVPCETKFSK